MTPVDKLFASMRMLTSPHAELLPWAASLWPALAVPDSSTTCDVLVERAGDEWLVEANRGGLVGLHPEAAEPARREEATFFLFAFERRAAFLELLVEALVRRAPEAFLRRNPQAIVPIDVLAQDMLDTGHGGRSGSTPQQTEQSIRRVTIRKVVRAPLGDVPLSDLVQISS